MGFVFFNDFKWLQHHQRKAHFPLVFVFMPFQLNLWDLDDDCLKLLVCAFAQPLLLGLLALKNLRLKH